MKASNVGIDMIKEVEGFSVLKLVGMALLLSGCASTTSTTQQKISLHLLTFEATSNVAQEVKSK